jgi:hypothetical protein
MEENKNYGVIIVEPNPGDYIVGASPLPIEIINPSGNNLPYAPDEEHQSGNGDKMDCVTVSSSGSFETIFKIIKDKLPQSHKDWLNKWKFGDTVQLSTRWAAIQNGTTRQGNSANQVAEWWRKNGFIPEWMLPNNQSLNWDEFYDTSCLTEEMKLCAKESLEYFSIGYEWILKDTDYHQALQRGAIQILTAVCPGWGSQNPIPACSLEVAHATELLNVQYNNTKDIWDSYDPHHKVFASDYPVPYRMLYLLKPIIKDNDMIFKKAKNDKDVYLINEEFGTKTMIADMSTLDAFYGKIEEVDNLNNYIPKGTFIWVDRIIN